VEDKSDFKYSTLIAGAGVFYCARERRWSEVGVKVAHIQLDASWFWFCNSEGDSTNPLGPVGYVKRWHKAALTPEAPHSSGGVPTRQIRRVYLVIQEVPDHWGPVMAPDVIEGQHVGAWLQADRVLEYNRLAGGIMDHAASIETSPPIAS
jgi:hypothetical protein